MKALLAKGAEPSLIDKDGNNIDAAAIVAKYDALSSDAAAEDGTKDEL